MITKLKILLSSFQFTYDGFWVYVKVLGLQAIVISMVKWLLEANTVLAFFISLAGLLVTIATFIHIREMILNKRKDRQKMDLEIQKLELDIKELQEKTEKEE